MTLQHILFSPQGRIAPRDFARGMVVVTAAMVVILVLIAAVNPGFGLLQYGLVYSYVCLFGKRLHDGGYTAWLYIPFLIGYFIATGIVSAILLPFLSPGAYAMQQELQTIILEGGMAAAMEAMAEQATEITQASALTTVATFLIVSGLIGWIGYALPSDPDVNRHGGPTRRSSPQR